MDPTAALTWWQIILYASIPAGIMIVPSILSAIAANKAAKLSQNLQLRNDQLERERLALEKDKSEGQISDDIASAYNKLNSDLQKEQERLRNEIVSQRLLFDAERNRYEIKFGDLATQIGEQAKRILHLEQGVRTLVRQVHDISPGTVPAFVLDRSAKR
jgi:biopolymer transport protein ExbB/TolQ